MIGWGWSTNPILRSVVFVVVAGAVLSWPAWWNGYPIVFGDTRVYLTDGLTLHVSWPRPFFYGVAMAALHWKLAAWPVVAGQVLAAGVVLRVILRLFAPDVGEAVQYGVLAVLAVGTSLPWFASQLMPDLFGALAVLAVSAAVLRAEVLLGWQQVMLVLAAAGFVCFHQSFSPTMLACGAALLAVRWWLGWRVGWRDLVRAWAAPAMAVAATVAVNTVFEGRVAYSPYGNIFLLARLIVEGPGERTLARECPRPGWTLCGFVGRFPDTVEAFQFGDEGTISLAGGHQVVAAQAGPIIADTFAAEGGAVVAAAAWRAVLQFARFETGDWLLRPHPDVDARWARVFPAAEMARYRAARQQLGLELVPDWLQAVHVGLGWAGLAGLAAGLVATLRERRVVAGLLLGIAVALVVNAVISGALSGVYDRYQSRYVWLGVFGTLVWVAGRGRRGSVPA